MKSGTCPKCGSNEIIPDLRLRGGQGYPPFVDISEPEPPNRPFDWVPRSEQSRFRAYICGNCGYTEFYAAHFQALNEAHQKGYRSTGE
jgi:predicted nucleic-acid-binding Zn-ribbon protein